MKYLIILLLILPMASAQIYRDVVAENTYQFAYPFNETNKTATFNFIVNYKAFQEKTMTYDDGYFKVNLTGLQTNDFLAYNVEVYDGFALINNTETINMIWDLPKSFYVSKRINKNDIPLIGWLLLLIVILAFVTKKRKNA